MSKKCDWCIGNDLYEKYHDEEWGVPCFDDHKLFEFLILEGAQAGLSWLTILKRRENYREAFANFDAGKIARFTEKDVKRLMEDSGIIRNQQKIRSAIHNAQCYLDLVEEKGSFADYLWDYVDGKPVQNAYKAVDELPATSSISDLISRDMKKRGFKFFGTTICYAHMQAMGMVNDHIMRCPRHTECAAMAS